MQTIETLKNNYLHYCQTQKRLDEKTLKAYRIDLKQFLNSITQSHISDISSIHIENYVTELHSRYKPKSVKRKIASVKAFFHYLEYKDLLEHNPFNKIQLHFKEPITLPKTIPLNTVELLLSEIYSQHQTAKTIYQRRNTLRDIAVAELLFSTGMRISELCGLNPQNITLSDGTILIYGKGSKERRIRIGNENVIAVLKSYQTEFAPEIENCNHFFANQSGRPLSDQCVRRMLNKYTTLAAINMHITPHMFRHTFATCLLEADVDIRFIQEMLGHSSIKITEIYTHVAVEKQRIILATKHPRKNFNI